MARYVIEKRIGEGGMAEVFLARAEGPAGFARRVAVKRLKASLAKDEELRTRFIDEARIAATLDHACIVAVNDFYEESGTHHLAMEFVDGTTAQELQVRGLAGRFVPARTIGYLLHEVARALEHAHKHAVLHRDVSLCNVLVANDGAVKLADFGLAKAAERLWTSEPGSIAGKLTYLSPERRRGAESCPGDDLYALGVCLGFLLQAADPRKPGEPGRAPLAALHRRLTHADVAARPASATALLEELRALPLGTPEDAAALVAPAAVSARPRRALRNDDFDDTTDDSARTPHPARLADDDDDDDDEATVIEPRPRGSRQSR